MIYFDRIEVVNYLVPSAGKMIYLSFKMSSLRKRLSLGVDNWEHFPGLFNIGGPSKSLFGTPYSTHKYFILLSVNLSTDPDYNCHLLYVRYSSLS